MISFSVTGTPVGQGSMRHVGGGRLIHSKHLIEWRNQVIDVARGVAAENDILDGPLGLVAHFTIPIPKKPLNKWPISRRAGDLDKQIRTIGDALTQSGLITDDSHICHIVASKSYGEEGSVTITIGKLE